MSPLYSSILGFLDSWVDLLKQIRSISHIDSFEHGHAFCNLTQSKGPQILLLLYGRDAILITKSLYMIRGIPNYCFYSRPFYGWRFTISKHTTLHIRNHGDLKSKDHVHHHHYENRLWHLYNDPCSVLMAGQSSTLFFNMYPYVDLISHIHDL